MAGSKPFAIHAEVTSSLALRGVGKGTYDNEWIDAQHWHRVIRFPDFEQTELRNDAGHSWTDQSNAELPIRIAEMLRFVVFHAPSSSAASMVSVSETSMTGDHGQSLTCYKTALPASADGFARQFGWCFEKASGLLVSEDFPLDMHVAYSNYISFQGKHEFTHVSVTSGSFQVLDIDIRYEPLDAHALDKSEPYRSMHRSESAGATPNPEELGKGAVEYRFNPPLPAGTPDKDKNEPVHVLFHVGADNSVLDASVEDAPTQAMGEAALQAARKFTFAPLMLDGKPAANHFYYSIWFRSGADDASSAGNADGRAGLGSGGVYQSEKPSFVFRYPAGFEQIPRGELEEQQRAHSGLQYGPDRGAACNTLLFSAQRLRPGERSPDVVSIYDLSSMCIFGLLDHKALETTAENGARTILAQLKQGSVSKPEGYTVDGRAFAVVSVSGVSHATSAEQVNALVVVTKIHEDIVGWTILGPHGDLAAILQACTLQTGEEREIPLFGKP